mmetsp:Transcript_107277/g.298844  ORF Transcript_107277/g.298844 Transcript_107277/m.298844 type:complete len:233 (-) Transcript_107277:209-907(-)
MVEWRGPVRLACDEVRNEARSAGPRGEGAADARGGSVQGGPAHAPPEEEGPCQGVPLPQGPHHHADDLQHPLQRHAGSAGRGHCGARLRRQVRLALHAGRQPAELVREFEPWIRLRELHACRRRRVVRGGHRGVQVPGHRVRQGLHGAAGPRAGLRQHARPADAPEEALQGHLPLLALRTFRPEKAWRQSKEDEHPTVSTPLSSPCTSRGPWPYRAPPAQVAVRPNPDVLCF